MRHWDGNNRASPWRFPQDHRPTEAQPVSLLGDMELAVEALKAKFIGLHNTQIPLGQDLAAVNFEDKNGR